MGRWSIWLHPKILYTRSLYHISLLEALVLNCPIPHRSTSQRQEYVRLVSRAIKHHLDTENMRPLIAIPLHHNWLWNKWLSFSFPAKVRAWVSVERLFQAFVLRLNYACVVRASLPFLIQILHWRFLFGSEESWCRVEILGDAIGFLSKWGYHDKIILYYYSCAYPVGDVKMSW
jgi:hypothetical protein